MDRNLKSSDSKISQQESIPEEQQQEQRVNQCSSSTAQSSYNINNFPENWWFTNPSTTQHSSSIPHDSINNSHASGELIEHPTSYILETDDTEEPVHADTGLNQIEEEDEKYYMDSNPSSTYSEADANGKPSGFLDDDVKNNSFDIYNQIKSAPPMISNFNGHQRNIKTDLLDSTTCIPPSNPGTYNNLNDFTDVVGGNQAIPNFNFDDQSPESRVSLTFDNVLTTETQVNQFQSQGYQHLNPSSSLKKFVDDNNDDRQNIQNALLRNNSVRSKMDLDLIKDSLLRSKSVYSKKADALNDTPLLFSQGIRRSRSLKTFNRKFDIMSQIIPRSLIDDNEVQATESPLKSEQNEFVNDGKKEETILVDGKQQSSEINRETDNNYLEKEIPYYNPITQETELNALKPTEILKTTRRKFFPVSPPFKTFYKAENKNLNQSIDNDIKAWTKKSASMTSKTKKMKSDKKKYIVIWILFVFLMASLCILIPLLIVYSRGTDSTVLTYLGNITPNHRQELLQGFFNSQGLSDSRNAPLLSPNSTITRGVAINKSLVTLDPSSSVAGISKFSNIPPKYRANSEIKSVMDNPALKNVFYGIDYAPRGVIYPTCGVTLHDVMLDVALLSQITSRIRTYGTQCDQAKFILESINILNLNVSLSAGVWIGPNDENNREQINDLKYLLGHYPRKYFESIYVGNEVLFREDQKPEALARYIEEVKGFVQQDMKWNLPVGTSELGSKATKEIMEVSDIFGSNTHPFFNGDTVQTASKWVFDFVKFQVEPVREESLGKPEVIISEIGWPYSGGKYNKAIAGKRQFQYFLNDWICDSKKENYHSYYFEAFDEPWKEVYYTNESKWETEWGIFTKDRKLKEGIIFPMC